MTFERTGILLLNLGTPDAPTVPAVRRFLREFLSDPYVIDIPVLARWILLNTVILPFRTKQTTHAYQQIWTERGSPLLLNSQALANALQTSLGENSIITLGMRYGKPSIEAAVNTLLSHPIEKLLIIPLYPQYAKSTTESSIQYATKYIRKNNNTIPIQTIREFYADSSYIDATANLIKNTIKDATIDKFIFSYHGLPERSIHSVCHEKENCDLKKPCPKVLNNNHDCYRAQCFATSQLIAEKLSLQKDDYIVTFQSRLGKIPWITPYTDHTLNHLAEQGIKNIAIACPSFVSDCLETLEEIDIRGKQQWKALGGHDFIRIPCLNANTTWVNALAHRIKGM